MTMTKTGTTREERKLLEDAGKIIQRELSNGENVRIRGLGRFNVSLIEANMAGPGSAEKKMATIGVVRFKPFDALKKTVRDIGGGTSKPAEKSVVQVINEKVDEKLGEKKAKGTFLTPGPYEVKKEEAPAAVAAKPDPTDPAKKIDWL